MRNGSWIVVGLLLAACAPSKDAPLRSPTVDYPEPPPTTPDGKVVGADNRSPADTLDSGARVGSGGVLPSPGAPQPERRSASPAASASAKPPQPGATSACPDPNRLCRP